ncbi:MAG: AAA family ATPase [Oscillospiraceae bacterium]|jgi:CO dehydrogenase maturation factor|nr:AAA family ATPase [Oscillospiraceae bacterium]
MAYTIAVAGKGGTGKTTITGLLIHYLAKLGTGPVLAVDADANSNLNEVLGVPMGMTLGDLREELERGDMMEVSPIPPSMSKADYTELKFASALTEMDDYDMIVMGRTQGSGCYCFVNGLLQHQIQKFGGAYKYVVVDNEAGMEHISRGVLPAVDCVLLVSDCSRRGVQAVGRIQQLVRDLRLNPTKMGLVVNRAPNGVLSDGIREEIELQGLELIAVVPQDSQVYDYDSQGRPLVDLPEDAPVKVAVRELVKLIAE